MKVITRQYPVFQLCAMEASIPSMIRTRKISPKIALHFQVLDALWLKFSTVLHRCHRYYWFEAQTSKNSQPSPTNDKSYFQRNIRVDLLVLNLKYKWRILHNELLSIHSTIWIFFSHKSQLFHKYIPSTYHNTTVLETCDSH